MSKTEAKTTLYTIALTPEQMESLKRNLDRRLWAFYEVDHAAFAFKGDKVNVVAYKSGKLVVQGKQTESFVTNILEPEVTKSPQLGYDEVHHPEWYEPHAGMDESGKGDLFGPLVVATVIADGEMVRTWMQKGVKDSKAIGSDQRIFDLEKIIRTTQGVVVETAFAGMPKYNELYAKFNNLNRLLAWFHARALEAALNRRLVPWGLLDQFSKQPITASFLKEHKGFDLRQRTKAESDPVVAAASIIARAQYVRAIRALEEQAGMEIPKGSGSQAAQALRELVAKKGRDCTSAFVKEHFKTVAEVVGS
jgi:ribonuclease HIII